MFLRLVSTAVLLGAALYYNNEWLLARVDLPPHLLGHPALFKKEFIQEDTRLALLDLVKVVSLSLLSVSHAFSRSRLARCRPTLRTSSTTRRSTNTLARPCPLSTTAVPILCSFPTSTGPCARFQAAWTLGRTTYGAGDTRD